MVLSAAESLFKKLTSKRVQQLSAISKRNSNPDARMYAQMWEYPDESTLAKQLIDLEEQVPAQAARMAMLKCVSEPERFLAFRSDAAALRGL